MGDGSEAAEIAENGDVRSAIAGNGEAAGEPAKGASCTGDGACGERPGEGGSRGATSPTAEGSYLRSEFPRAFTILGQHLRPLSLWHLMVLLRFENGFVWSSPDGSRGTTSPTVSAGDLFLGVFFCCQSWEEGCAALEDDGWREKVEGWGEAVAKDITHGPIGIKEGALVWDFGEKAVLFAEYLWEGFGRPELLPAEGDSRVPGAPLLLMLKLFLIRELRCSESEAMNYSFAKACHKFFAHHEALGAAKIVNEDERGVLDEHDAEVRALLDEQAAVVEKIKKGLTAENAEERRERGRF